MKAFLISSNYQYYDDFDFQPICVCSTKEKANELVFEFNKNKDYFSSLKGKLLYINHCYFKEFGDISELRKFYFKDECNIQKHFEYTTVFLTNEDLKPFKKQIKNTSTYTNDMTFADYLGTKDRTTIERKYCNHPEAILGIKEIDYIIK